MTQGYIKFYREWLDNPIITKDADYLAVWTYLMSNATHTDVQGIFGNKLIALKPGQMLIKQKEMADKLSIDRFKAMRILRSFENAHLITHLTDKRKTLITLEQWAVYQGLNKQSNAHPLHFQCTSEQETENEKEKRSKREKEKDKEINKNEKREECVCIGEHTQNPPLILGRYKNVLVDKAWLDSFKSNYAYANTVIDRLSVYKQAKGISNSDDRPYLEQFAMNDKDKYIKKDSSYDTFDADDFFNAALARSYADDDD